MKISNLLFFKFICLILFFFIVPFSTIQADPTDGTEDTDFYTNLGTGFDNSVSAIAVQSDGDVVLGGGFSSLNGNARLYLVRLNSDGTEDTAFYTNLGTGFDSNVSAIAVQSDGDILVGGSFSTLNGNERLSLVRLNSDGTEDTDFYTNLGTGFASTVNKIEVQSDGDILVGGAFGTFNDNTRNRIVRLNSDGTEDTAFYTNLGTAVSVGNINDIAVQSDGDIVLVGSFTSFNGSTRNRIVRRNSDGTEDTDFYTNLGTGFGSFINSVFIQSDGDILLGGFFSTFNGSTRNRIVRLNSDGTEDTAFYTNLGTGFGSSVADINASSS